MTHHCQSKLRCITKLANVLKELLIDELLPKRIRNCVPDSRSIIQYDNDTAHNNNEHFIIPSSKQEGVTTSRPKLFVN
jgi:uncharacterized protein (UPF0147 family)